MERAKQPELNGAAKGPEQAPGPAAPPDPVKNAASASATKGAERPLVAEGPAAGALDAFANEPAPDKAPERGPAGPAPAAAETRSVNDLAKEPAVRAALEKALTDGTFKYDSLKTAVKDGLETGDFKFKTEGQERVVKTVIADAIKPDVPAQAPAAEKGPEAAGGKPEKAPLATIEKAIGNAEQKIPGGVDEQVKSVLRSSEAINALSERPFQRGKSFESTQPSLGDATRYANQVAVKTQDFSKDSIEQNFLEAYNQPTRGDLIKLSENNGVALYPPKAERPVAPAGEPQAGGRSRGLPAESPVENDSAYGRAIAQATEKGKELPPPANGERYTVGEARAMKEQGLLDLDSVARARQMPDGPKPKPQASFGEKEQILATLEKGFTKPTGEKMTGLPSEEFKSLSRPAQNEVRSLVKELPKFANASEAAGSLAVTSFLAKEFDEKVLKAREGQRAEEKAGA